MEALCQVLRIYDVGGKLLSGIKCMNVNSIACVRVKGRVCECFRIDSGVIQGFIRREWRVTGIFYVGRGLGFVCQVG